ncbi:hypothetical protein RND71_009003 [Anisodus tanguticus]|uniref:Uncharacterized protein n=1 Tax=Anisodus tanguticus TaxID=243964 RepID=A0AAE1SMY3_9SOLA|nr:hypothetical protein RND71_009003 [Anisodus tanguticus]
MLGIFGMFGSDGMFGVGGRVIFGTIEGKVGKEGNGELVVGSVGKDDTLGNGGNVAAVGKFGIVGNCGIVG